MLVDSWRQAAAAAAIPYYAAAAAYKKRKYVGFRAYFLKPSSAPGKCHAKIPYGSHEKNVPVHHDQTSN